MEIQFDVVNQHLCVQDGYFVVSGSENYITAKFTFSEDWDELTKTAVFRLSGNAEEYTAELAEDKCTIPADVLSYPGMRVYVTGTDGDVVICTNAEMVDIKKSGHDDTDDVGESVSGSEGGTSFVIDDVLSPVSENAVMNKTIYVAIQGRAARDHTHTAEDVGAVNCDSIITNEDILKIMGVM